MDVVELANQALIAVSALAGAAAAYFRYRRGRAAKSKPELVKEPPRPMPSAAPKPVIDDEAVSKLIAELRYVKNGGDNINVQLGKEKFNINDI